MVVIRPGFGLGLNTGVFTPIVPISRAPVDKDTATFFRVRALYLGRFVICCRDAASLMASVERPAQRLFGRANILA